MQPGWLLTFILITWHLHSGCERLRASNSKWRALDVYLRRDLSNGYPAYAGGDGYYTLEFSANMLANLPGRLQYFSSPDAEPVVVVDDLIWPTSLALDEETGDIYVTEIFTGRIIRVEIE